MNNFQKISSAVLLLAASLGLTACEQNAPEEPCIAIIPEYAAKCGPDAPKKDKRYCLGEDFICTKPNPSDTSTDGGGTGW